MTRSTRSQHLPVHESRATLGRLCAGVLFVLLGTGVTVTSFLESTARPQAPVAERVTDVTPEAPESTLQDVEASAELSTDAVVVVPAQRMQRG